VLRQDHIFFKCHLAKMIWEMFKEIFRLDSGAKGQRAMFVEIDHFYLLSVCLDSVDNS
jgi:hypothetical protein